MKLLIISLMLIISANANASRLWSSISIEDQVYMARDLKIQNSNLLIQSSSKLKVTDINLMEMINVYLFKIKLNSCPNPKETSELELYTINQGRGQTTVGIELLKNCSMEIYVEKGDYKTVSLFN